MEIILSDQLKHVISHCNLVAGIPINASMNTYTIRLKFIMTVNMPHIIGAWVTILPLS